MRQCTDIAMSTLNSPCKDGRVEDLKQEVADVGSALFPGRATKWCDEDGQWLRQLDSSSSRRHATLCSADVGAEEETSRVCPPPTNQSAAVSQESICCLELGCWM